MISLINSLRSISNVSNDLHIELEDLVNEKHVPKKGLLLRPGQVCGHIYFVKKGILRTYYYKGNKNISSSFAAEGEVCVSIESFFAQQHGIEGIEALEASIVYYISFDQYQHLNSKFPDFATISRLLLEKCLVARERRMVAMWMQSSMDCYIWLINQLPSIQQRVSGKFIASYLGITEPMLSRNKALLHRKK